MESGNPPPRKRAAIPMIHDGIVYDGVSVAPWVHAFDAATGKERWRPHVKGPVKGGLVLDDGVLYFGDGGGYLWAVESATGQIIGSKHMADRFSVGSPIIVGNTLIIGGQTGYGFAEPIEGISQK